VETYSDLLIQREVEEVEEGSMAVICEKGDRDQQASCQKCGGGWAIEEGWLLHQRNRRGMDLSPLILC